MAHKKNIQQSWRICFIHGGKRRTRANVGFRHKNFSSSASPAPHRHTSKHLSFFPSHQRTQWIVNKWKRRKRVTSMEMMMNRSENKMTFYAKRLLSPSALYDFFSHGSKTFIVMSFLLFFFLFRPFANFRDAAHPCQEFIIISFWYFKQWKSNINLIKLTNVFLIPFPFLFLPFSPTIERSEQ